MSSGEWPRQTQPPQVEPGAPKGIFASPLAPSQESVFGVFRSNESSSQQVHRGLAAPTTIDTSVTTTNVSGPRIFGNRSTTSFSSETSERSGGSLTKISKAILAPGKKLESLRSGSKLLGSKNEPSFGSFGQSSSHPEITPQDVSTLFGNKVSSSLNRFIPTLSGVGPSVDKKQPTPFSSIYKKQYEPEDGTSYNVQTDYYKAALKDEEAGRFSRNYSSAGENLSGTNRPAQGFSIFMQKQAPSVTASPTLFSLKSTSPDVEQIKSLPNYSKKLHSLQDRRKRSFESDRTTSHHKPGSVEELQPKKRSFDQPIFVTVGTSSSQDEDVSNSGHSKLSRKVAVRQPNVRLRKISSSVAEQAAALKSNAIICHDVPTVIKNRQSLREHFGRFGDITRIALNGEKNTATITFKSHEEAASAKIEGAYVDESVSPMKIYFVKKARKSAEKPPVQRNEATEMNRLVKHKPIASARMPAFKISGIKSGSATRALMQKPVFARTDEEKLAILEKIDTQLKKQVVKQSDIKKARLSKGTCPDMCPEKERYLRQQRKLLAYYEMNGDCVDHSKAVKEYSRSSADQDEPLPHELRPASVLQMTMHYLLREMMPKLFEGQIAEWYDFVWNRTRAIRKELTIQQISDLIAVRINEQCARFHIFCAHQLCEEDRMVFDPKINNENLEKTMKTILDLYRDIYFTSAQNDILGNSNIAELYGYYIMLNINKTAEVLNELQELPHEIRFSDDIAIAVEAFMAVHSNNYVKFFKVVKRATFLQGCILHRYFTQVRNQAVTTMAKAFVATQDRRAVLFPTEDFTRLLSFNNMHELALFCQHHGIVINSDNMMELSRSGLKEQESSLAGSRSNLVLEKMKEMNLAEVIAKCELAVEHHEPYSSFDENGRYIGEYASLLSSENLPDSFQALKQPESIEKDQVSLPQVLPPGVTNTHVKIVAKELFHEIIDDISLSVANEMWEAVFASIIVREMLEEILREASTEISHEITDAALAEKKKEEDRRRMIEEGKRKRELMERDEQRRREQREMEEKIERERKRMEREEMKRCQSEVIAAQLQKEIEDSIIKAVATEVHKELTREHRITVSSEQERTDIINEIVAVLSKGICECAWKEAKKAKCMKILSERNLHKLHKAFKRWQMEKGLKVKFENITKTFPSVPLSRQVGTQIRSLLPNQRSFQLKRELSSFPLDAATELSLRSPMDLIKTRERCSTFIGEAEVKLHDSYLKATRPLPFCDMLRKATLKANFYSAVEVKPVGILWKIALQLPQHCEENTLFKWLKQAFLASNTDVCWYSTAGAKNNGTIDICCSILSEDHLNSDLIGSFSIVLALAPPSTSRSDPLYWARARSQLEGLVLAKPSIPPVPLLVILLGWDVDREVLEKFLNITTLRWKVCVLRDGLQNLLENYNELVKGVEFLFESLPPLPSLTTVPLRELFEKSLSTNYVVPLCEHISRRKRARLTPLSPNHQIQFYNSVIESLASAASSEDFKKISWPPIQLPAARTLDLPIQGWNSSKTQCRNYSSMLTCQVPAFPDFPKMLTENAITKTALAYAEMVCPSCPALVSVVTQRVTVELRNLRDQIFLDSEDSLFEEVAALGGFDWHSIIDCIISQHLTNILYCSPIGEYKITFPSNAFSNMQLDAGFEAMFGETLLSPVYDDSCIKEEIEGEVGDSFGELEYSFPEKGQCDTTWMKEESEVGKVITGTESLCEKLKQDRQANSEYEEKLKALLREGEAPFNVLDSDIKWPYLLDISNV